MKGHGWSEAKERMYPDLLGLAMFIQRESRPSPKLRRTLANFVSTKFQQISKTRKQRVCRQQKVIEDWNLDKLKIRLTELNSESEGVRRWDDDGMCHQGTTVVIELMHLILSYLKIRPVSLHLCMVLCFSVSEPHVVYLFIYTWRKHNIPAISLLHL